MQKFTKGEIRGLVWIAVMAIVGIIAAASVRTCSHMGKDEPAIEMAVQDEKQQVDMVESEGNADGIREENSGKKRQRKKRSGKGEEMREKEDRRSPLDEAVPTQK